MGTPLYVDSSNIAIYVQKLSTELSSIQASGLQISVEIVENTAMSAKNFATEATELQNVIASYVQKYQTNLSQLSQGVSSIQEVEYNIQDELKKSTQAVGNSTYTQFMTGTGGTQ